jgi:hypothetical protein
MNRKFRISAGGVLLACAAAAAFSPPQNPGKFRNLRVLPKHINSKNLNGIMLDEFNSGLGVSCGFCHASQQGSHQLDYASDEKSEKEIARQMIRMTLALNRKYFQQRHPVLGDDILVITCNTCHHGQPHPENSGAP